MMEAGEEVIRGHVGGAQDLGRVSVESVPGDRKFRFLFARQLSVGVGFERG
jgi:hypothetical protein